MIEDRFPKKKSKKKYAYCSLFSIRLVHWLCFDLGAARAAMGSKSMIMASQTRNIETLSHYVQLQLSAISTSI